MIPENGRTILNLQLKNARDTESDAYAEECLVAASAILGYACAVNHLTPAEYSNELVMVQLVRAQRKNRAAARS
jgi:hypothetical protein